MLNVLGRLVMLEPRQSDLLDRICAAATIPLDELMSAIAGAPSATTGRKRSRPRNEKQTNLLD